MIEKIDPSSIVRASHTTPKQLASLLHSVAITKMVLPATVTQSFAKATIFRLLRDGSSEVAIIHQDCDGALAVSPLRSKGEDSSSYYLRVSSIQDFCLVEVQEGHVYALLLHSNSRVLSVVAVSSGLTVSSMQCSSSSGDDQFQAISLVSESYSEDPASPSNSSSMAAISHHLLVMLHRKDMSQQHQAVAQLVSISFLGTSCRMVPLGCGPLMTPGPGQVASDLPYRITASTCRMRPIDVNAETQPSSFLSLVDAQRVTIYRCSQSVSKQLRDLLQGLMHPLHSPDEHASAMQSLGRIIHRLLQPADISLVPPSSSESVDALLSVITPQIHCSDVLSLTYALLDLPYPPQGFVSKLLTHAEVPINESSSSSSSIQRLTLSISSSVGYDRAIHQQPAEPTQREAEVPV